MMKPLPFRPGREANADVARLAREMEEQVGEDNVIPWLLVHRGLVGDALQGRRYGLIDAIKRVNRCRS